RVVEEGNKLADLPGRHQLSGDLPGLRSRAAPPQLGHPFWRAGNLKATGLSEHAELLVLLGAVAGQLHHHLRVVDVVDEVGRVPCGAARIWHGPLVYQHEIPPAQPGQVVGEAVANDSRADDDGACTARDVTHGLELPQRFGSAVLIASSAR